MQGLVVVPLFAGYDTRRQIGRLFQYDVTGGRYEEAQLRHHRLGQPARRHGRQARLPRGPRPRRHPRPRHLGPVQRRRRGLRHRRPRPRARHLPHHGHDHRTGLRAGRRDRDRRALPHARRAAVARPRAPASAGADADARPRVTPDEHAVLRRARAGDEGPGRLRPQGHRPGPQPRRPHATTTASCSAPRTRRTRCTRWPRSTTASPSPASASTTSSTSCGSSASAPPTSPATSSAART